MFRNEKLNDGVWRRLIEYFEVIHRNLRTEVSVHIISLAPILSKSAKLMESMTALHVVKCTKDAVPCNMYN